MSRNKFENPLGKESSIIPNTIDGQKIFLASPAIKRVKDKLGKLKEAEEIKKLRTEIKKK